eukprot:gene13337-13466_t
MWALPRLQQPAVAQVWLLPLLSLVCDSAVPSAGSPDSSQWQQPTPQPSAGTPSAVGMQAVANVLWACTLLLCTSAAGRRLDLSGSGVAAAAAAGATAPGTRKLQLHTDRQQLLMSAVRQQSTLLVLAHRQQLQAATPQELTMLLYAISKLGLHLGSRFWASFWPASQPVLASCMPKECCVLLCALAVLGLPPPAAWAAQLLRVMLPGLLLLSAHDISSAVWSLGTLRLRPPAAWLAAAFQGCTSRWEACSPLVVSRLVAGASKLGYRPPPATMTALLTATQQQVAQYSSHQLSKLLLGSAALRLELLQSQQQFLLTAFCSLLPAVSASDVTMVLRSLALRQAAEGGGSSRSQRKSQQQLWQMLRHSLAGSARLMHARPAPAATPLPVPPPAPSPSRRCVAEQHLLQQLVCCAEQVMHSMTAVELCQCIWSAAWLGFPLSPDWSYALNYTLPQRMQQLGPGDVCQLLWSLARLQGALLPKPQLHKELLLHSQRLMLAGRFGARDLAGFVWSYAQVFALQAPPKPWLLVFCRASSAQVMAMDARQLGVLLHGLVLLGAAAIPEQQLLDAACLKLDLLLAVLTKSELASIKASIVQLQQRRVAAGPRRSIFGSLQEGDVPLAPPTGSAVSAAPCQPVQLQMGGNNKLPQLVH